MYWSGLNSNLEKTIKWRKAWTNPSPNSDFAPQSIPLGGTDYDVVKVYFKVNKDNVYNVLKCCEYVKGYDPLLDYAWTGGYGTVTVVRAVTGSTNPNYARFGDCFTAIGTSAEVKSNGAIIPIEIWLGSY